MNIFKRSLVSTIQRKGKSLILLLVVFILGNVIAAAVTIRDSTANVEKSMKEQLGAVARVDYNMDSFTGGNVDPKDMNLSPDEADRIGEDKRVKSYNYTYNTPVGSSTLKPHEGKQNGMMQANGDAGYFDFTLVGSKNPIPDDVNSGKVSIVDGRIPNAEDNLKNPYTAAISEEVAKKNNLKIGDKIILNQSVIDFGEPSSSGISMSSANFDVKETITKEFEIVGIFKRNKSESKEQFAEFMEDMDRNKMYTTFDAIREIDALSAAAIQKFKGGNVEDHKAPVTPTYRLNSVDDLESFVNDYKEQLPKALKFTTSQESYQAVASSITNMNQLASNVYVFGVIVTIVILSLVVVIFLRERKPEFGIYQALGEPRYKTLSQIAIEVILVTFVGVSLAVFSGNALAKGMSEQMVANQLASDEAQKNQGGMMMAVSIGGDDMPSVTKEEIIENYKVSLTPEYIISFYEIMLITAGVSTIVAMGYILRFKPREILL